MSQADITANPSGENFAELLDQSFQEMASIEGSVVSGTVLSIDKDIKPEVKITKAGKKKQWTTQTSESVIANLSVVCCVFIIFKFFPFKKGRNYINKSSLVFKTTPPLTNWSNKEFFYLHR